MQSGSYSGEMTNNNSWNGFRKTSNDINVVQGVGRKGSGALEITYSSQNGVGGEASLLKWLGEEGYDDIYLSYYFKFYIWK